MTNNQPVRIRRAAHDAENRYFMLCRETAQDRNLSYEARGVLAYLLSKPADWVVRVKDLQQPGCGRDKVYRILKELETHRYLAREFIRNKGVVIGMEYVVYESPFPEKPDTAQPDTANTEHTEYREEQSTEESTENTKEERLVPTGTDEPASQTEDTHANRLDAVKDALHFGDDSYPIVAKYVQLLTGSVPAKDSKGRSNGDWHEYQLPRGMSAVEIRAFGLWLADEYDGEPLRKPSAVLDYAGRFRADGDHDLYMQRAARGQPSAPFIPPEQLPEPADIICDAEQADVLATLAMLTEKVSS